MPDRDREPEEGTAQALVCDELRHGRKRLPVRGVRERIAVFELPDLQRVFAQPATQHPLTLPLLGGERRHVAGQGDLCFRDVALPSVVGPPRSGFSNDTTDYTC